MRHAHLMASATQATARTSDKLRVLVERLQCPGCVHGVDTRCGWFRPEPFSGGASCAAQVAGHSLDGVRRAIGLPHGFQELGVEHFSGLKHGAWPLVIYEAGTHGGFGPFNVPVWALEGDGRHAGFLFVRVVEPRFGRCRVDVIEDGRLSDAPGAIDARSLLGSHIDSRSQRARCEIGCTCSQAR